MSCSSPSVKNFFLYLILMSLFPNLVHGQEIQQADPHSLKVGASSSLQQLPGWPPHPKEVMRHHMDMSVSPAPHSGTGADPDGEHYRGKFGSIYLFGTPQTLRVPDRKYLVITDIIFHSGGVPEMRLVAHKPKEGAPFPATLNLKERRKLSSQLPSKDPDRLITLTRTKQLYNSNTTPTSFYEAAPHSGTINLTTGLVVPPGAVLDLTAELPEKWQEKWILSTNRLEATVIGYYYRAEPVYSASHVLNKIQQIEEDLGNGPLSASLRREVLDPLGRALPTSLVNENTQLKSEIQALKNELSKAKTNGDKK